MSLQAGIEADVKQAMRAGNTLARDTLRMVLAALKNRRIEVREDLDEEMVLAVLRGCVKTRADSVEQYSRAGREDLAAKERAEIEVIQAYLPEQLSEDATREIVAGLVAELELSSRKDMGKLMKVVMAKHKDEIDGKTVQRIASELLD